MNVKVGIIGDFDPVRQSHQATNEALHHCADYLGITLELEWLPTVLLEKAIDNRLGQFDGFWCAPGVYGSGNGALRAIKFARENDYPFIGTCAGFQYTVMEYARNKLGLDDVQHAEYNPGAANLIITPLACSLVGETRKILINENSTVFKYYGKAESTERFSCNFGINDAYRQMIEESGFKIVSIDEQGEVRILELTRNRFFVATLFQPQLSSVAANPHKLILAYLHCLKEFHLQR